MVHMAPITCTRSTWLTARVATSSMRLRQRLMLARAQVHTPTVRPQITRTGTVAPSSALISAGQPLTFVIVVVLETEVEN